MVMRLLTRVFRRSALMRQERIFKSEEKTEISEIDAPPLSKELKKRWSYFIRKVYETDPLICPNCQGEMRIISFIDQPDVIKILLQHKLECWIVSVLCPQM